MSHDVSLQQLAGTMARYGSAYLLTVTDEGRAHAVAVKPTVVGGALLIGELGRRSRANAVARPALSLVWPPTEPGDYSLIVDGDASPSRNGVTVLPTRAVLHRPAPATGTSSSNCGSDCVPVAGVGPNDA